MIKKFNLKLIVFLVALMYSAVLSAQINSTTAVVPFGANPNYGTNGIMPTNLPTGGAYGKSQDAADAYTEWRNNYTESCGGGMYRVKFDEPNRTVSEGIAYGMQLAAYAADKTLFDGLYAYWKNFRSPNTAGKTGKLMNWRIEGCGPTVSGTGSAADADVDAAWALLIAENQWPTVTSPYDYASEATNMLYAIRELELNSSGQLINGDGWGFADNCRNPSYQSPAYYPYFATNNTAYAGAWNGAVSSAYSLVTANADGTTGLISDWSNPSGARNTCNPGGLGYAATDGYGYDACRNPWRMAQDVIWNNSTQGKAQCAKIAAYLNGRGAGNVGGPLYQNGSNYSGYAHNATFVATFATAVMGSTNQTLMNSMYTETKNTKDVIKNSTLSGYFGNTLRCVALFMMSGNYWKPGTSSVQEINVRQGALDYLNASTYDFQNQQTTPPAASGKSVTFTIENLGFATLNLTGTTKVVLGGTNANQFSVAQPAASSLGLAATTTFVVTFTPTTTGTKTATLTIASNDGDENPYVINLTGTGTANATAPKMTVYDTLNVLTSGSAFPMGAFTVGASGSKVLKITNTGDAPLNINTVTFSNVLFTVASPTLPLTIPIGGKAYLTIGYAAPATATSSTSTITLANTDPNTPSFVLNATASSAACSANPTNKMMLDYDGNINLKLAFTPTGAYSPIAANPSIGGLNVSPTVASYVRGTTGTYDIIRFYNCGTVAGATHAASTYVSFNMTAAAPTVQILFYSPAVGIPITLAPQKPDLTTAAAWLPINADYSSNISVTTTKANQWELLTFDLSKIIAPTNLTANIKCFDIQVDPLLAYSGLPANALAAKRTFYIDEIKYGINPCVNDLSGVLQDFDAHTNTTLDYAVAALSAPIANPVSGGINTSANVGQFTKTINAATYDDGFRYDGCGNKIDLSTKKYISMLVYSPVANASIQMSAKVPDGVDADIYPDDAAANTQLTVFANKWHRIYFDLSTVSAANLPNVFSLDIFFDPTDASAVSAPNNKFYFDDIRLESALPCVAGIPATDILNDFENNRYLGVVFPGATSFNTIKSNPVPTGINTSAIVGEFIRGTLTTGTSVRFSACQSKLDLAPGHNLIDLKVYSPNAKVAVVMSLKNAAGVSLSDVTDTIQLANTWTNLRFDHTNIMNSTAVAFIDVIVDPNAVFSGATSLAAARTYEFDDLQYAPPAPEINVKALTTPTTTDIPSTGSFNMGTAAIGDSTTALTFSIQNNGLQTLNLTGTPTLKLGGVNAADFVVTTTQTFSTTVGALGATGFSVMFKPQGTIPGPRSASLTIVSNDPNEGSYVIYFNATATVAVIKVLDGGLITSPIIATNNTPAINVGTSAVGVAAAAYTMSIKNTGTAPLKITSITPSAGFTVTALTPTGAIAPSAIATFTVIGTPAATGINTGTLTVVSNDPATPSYKVNITVTGSVPVISIQDATLTAVANNNTPAISVGTGPVGAAVTPAYTFTIRNTGTAPLTITSVTPTTGFTVTAVSPTGAIAASGSAVFTVTGTPAIAGVNTGSITIVSNDPTTPSYKVNVTVTGTVPALQVLNTTTVLVNNATPAISVGTATVATAATAYTSFSVKNNGTAPLTLTSITGSTGFAVSAITPTAPATIAPNGTATFTVIGTPALVGANTGTITIVTNDPTTPSFKINVSVTGTAAATPALQVLNTTAILTNNATPAISVGSSVVATAATAYTSFSIKNAGTAALTFTSITGSAGFVISAVTPAAPTSIAANGTATFTVTGTPAVLGANTGTITIVTNDPTTPSFVINVTVTGTAAPVPALQVLNTTTVLVNNATPAISVGTSGVTTPATAYTSFSIKNTGTAALSLTSITGSAGFVISAITPTAPTSIAANGTATFTVTGTPPLAGANAGTITIVTNDPTTPSFVINVSVTGTTAPKLQVLNTTTVLANNATPAISVGSAAVGTPATAYTSFSIKNTGTSALTFTSITGSTGFAISAVTPAAPTSIAVNGTATFTVTGTPAVLGANAGTITIVTNDPTTPSFVVNVSVTGIAASTPALQVLNTTAILTNNATPAISVGSALTGSAATAYTSFSIKNVGTAALTLTSITGSTGFAISAITPTTPTSIAVNGTATFTVTGTPAVNGANAGTITIVTNDPTTPSFVVNVSVTGTVPALQVLNVAATVTNNNTPAISVGTAAVASAATAYTSFSIKNTGTAPLSLTSITGSTGFAVSAITPTAPATIAPNGTATFTVTGTPSVIGANAGTITIVTNDPTTPSFKINVSVVGTPPPTPSVQVLNGVTVLTTNGTAIPVGSAVTGSPATAYTSFSIKNVGTAALTLTSITGSAGFAISAITPAAPATIAANGTATFTVIGTPAVLGANSGTITIVTNDPTTTSFVVNVTVTGTLAPAPALQVLNGATVLATNSTPAISVGSAVVATAGNAYTSFSIKNTGNAALTLTSITGSTGFAISAITPATPATIAANGTATFTVKGTPTIVGANTGTITIVTNDPTTPSFVINVSVTGTAAPQATVTIPGVTNNGTAVSIGTAVVGNPTAPYTFTISNTGSLPLNVGTITSSNPEFVVTQVSPNPIPAGGTGTFTVTATPSAIGTSTGKITIPSNDPSSPFVINVSATGTSTPTGPSLQLKGKSGQIIANNSSFIIGANTINTPTAPYTFTIVNIGGAPLTITNIIATSGFSAVQPTPATIAPGASGTFTVTGIPNNASATRFGSITIMSNDASSPFTLNVGVNVGTPTGVRALSSTEIEMFPNPTTLGYSNIEFNGSFDDVVVTVYSADGSRAIVKEFSSVVEATRQLDVQELPSGVYFVEVTTAQGTIMKRLIKQ